MYEAGGGVEQGRAQHLSWSCFMAQDLLLARVSCHKITQQQLTWLDQWICNQFCEGTSPPPNRPGSG